MPFTFNDGRETQWNPNDEAEKIDVGTVDPGTRVYLALRHHDGRELVVSITPNEAADLAVRLLAVAAVADASVNVQQAITRQANREHGKKARLN
jgi:hypothetical protein